MKTLLCGLALALAFQARGASLDCVAKVTIHPVRVTIAEAGGPSKMTVVTDTGTEYSGIASYTRSVPRRSETYFLQLNWQYQPAISLEVEDGGGRMAFCMKANECYTCR
jgi:hypothetical protein